MSIVAAAVTSAAFTDASEAVSDAPGAPRLIVPTPLPVENDEAVLSV